MCLFRDRTIDLSDSVYVPMGLFLVSIDLSRCAVITKDMVPNVEWRHKGTSSNLVDKLAQCSVNTEQESSAVAH